MTRKLILGALVLVLPLTTAVTMGAGAATARANLTGTGTFNCTKSAGTITFSPPIKNTPQTVKIALKDTATGCKGGKPTPLKVLITSSFTTKNETCSSLTKPYVATFTATYSPVVTPSHLTGTPKFQAGTSTVSYTVSGKVTGSYPSPFGQHKIVINQSPSQILAACAKGLSVLHIVAGTITKG